MFSVVECSTVFQRPPGDLRVNPGTSLQELRVIVPDEQGLVRVFLLPAGVLQDTVPDATWPGPARNLFSEPHPFSRAFSSPLVDGLLLTSWTKSGSDCVQSRCKQDPLYQNPRSRFRKFRQHNTGGFDGVHEAFAVANDELGLSITEEAGSDRVDALPSLFENRLFHERTSSTDILAPYHKQNRRE